MTLEKPGGRTLGLATANALEKRLFASVGYACSAARSFLAVKRGVEVKVMVPGDQIDMPMVRSASWIHYGDLLKNGARIYEYKPTMFHNKTMAVDGIFTTIGSINFDARSMNSNAEESMAFYDRGFAAKVEAMFNEDLKHCEEIKFERWDNRGLPKRLSELLFAGRRVQTVQQFIAGVASRSEETGKPYEIRLPDGRQTPMEAWLLERLAVHEKGRPRP